MKYRIYSFGYDSFHEVQNHDNKEDAYKAFDELVHKWCENHGVNIEDTNYTESDTHFEYGIDEKGAFICQLYEIPEFENRVEELLWDAKLHMDKAEWTATDYAYTLQDNCVGEHVLDAQRSIDKALELMKADKPRKVEKRLFKINRYYATSEFVEAASIDEVARYVAESDKKGQTVMSVTEINLDGTHPRVAINKLKAYKKQKKVAKAIKPMVATMPMLINKGLDCQLKLENCCKNCANSSSYTSLDDFYCVRSGCWMRAEKYDCKNFSPKQD